MDRESERMRRADHAFPVQRMDHPGKEFKAFGRDNDRLLKEDIGTMKRAFAAPARPNG